MKKIAAFCAVTTLIFLAACKPSTKNEINKYNVSVDNLKKYQSEFPAFKPQLEKLQNDSKAKWDGALKLKDEEKKAEAMNAVNDSIYKNDIYSMLGSYNGHVDNIKKLQSDLSKNRNKSFKNMVANAISGGDKALVEAKAILDNAKPKDDADAVEIIKKANGVLIMKAGDLRRVKKTVFPKKTIKRKKKDK